MDYPVKVCLLKLKNNFILNFILDLLSIPPKQFLQILSQVQVNIFSFKTNLSKLISQ